jgi:hypothetical protein
MGLGARPASSVGPAAGTYAPLTRTWRFRVFEEPHR